MKNTTNNLKWFRHNNDMSPVDIHPRFPGHPSSLFKLRAFDYPLRFYVSRPCSDPGACPTDQEESPEGPGLGNREQAAARHARRIQP